MALRPRGKTKRDPVRGLDLPTHHKFPVSRQSSRGQKGYSVVKDTTKPPTVPPVVPPTVEPQPGNTGDGSPTYCTEYTNRWGKRMVAADYGYKAWCFRDRTGRKTKS